MAVEFVSVDRNTRYLFPHCVQDYLPEDHLPRFVVDIVEQWDVGPLAAIRRARHEIEARARHRQEHERAAYEAKLADRQAREKKTGKKPGSRPPEPPVSGPRDHDQVNLTDEASRIMPTAGAGFEQSHNAQASVDIASDLIVSHHVSQQPHDQRELEPTLAQLAAQEGALGKVEKLLADAGYCSANNVKASLKARITPYPSTHREPRHIPLAARLTPDA